MPQITIRRATPEDALVCGAICYQAFFDINSAHNFPPDLPSPEAAVGVLTMMFFSPPLLLLGGGVGGPYHRQQLP